MKNILTGLFFILFSTLAWAQPANDNYAAAIDVSSIINLCSANAAFTTLNATADNNKGSLWDSGPNYNVWFKFTATTNYMKVQLNTGAPEGNMQYPYLALWSTNGTTELASANRIGQYTDLEVDYYGLTPGVEYYISVDNLVGAGYRGTFKLCLSDVVDYNFYEGAVDVTGLINGCSADAAYTTVNASADKNKGAAWDSGPNYNRWFKFTATTNYMKVQLNTGAPEGNMQYPYLALWSTNGTTELASANRIGQYTDLEVDYYGLTPGVEYYISVDNLVGAGYRGTFKLCLSDVVDYNFYEGAVDVTGLINGCSADAAYTTVNASADKNKGAAWDSGPNYNRWFKFTATTNYMKVQLNTGAPEGNMQYPYLALWSTNGTTELASANRIGQYTDLEVDYYGLTPGVEYYISVDNLVGAGYRGTFKLCLSDVVDYNFYEGAVDVTGLINGCSADAAYTTVNASADKNKGAAWDSGPNYNRWFKFTATTNYMKVQLNTGAPEGNMQYPYLALWSTNGTTELASANRIGQYTDLEVDYYGLTPGVEYYISVDNLVGAGYRGTFKLCLSDVVDYNFYEGAVDVTGLINGCSADAAYTTVNASADKNKGAAWDSGPNYNRWFKFTATTNYMKVQLNTGAPEGNMQYPYLALWSTNGTTELASANRIGQYTDLEVDYYGLTPGVEYYISVDNLVGAGYRGTFKLCLSDVVDYNFYEGAVDVTGLINGCSADAAYTTVNASADKNKGAAWDSGPNYNRWFKFTATTNYMKVQLNTGAPEGNMQYPYLALWSTNGTTELASANRIGQYTDLEVDYYGLTPGVEYYISVDNLVGAGYRGTFKLCLSDVVDYNFYEGAVDVTGLINGCSADAAYTTVNASADKNKGAAWDSGPNYNRWFKFTATTNYMKVQLNTGAPEGNMQYPYLALWSTNGTTELASANRIGQYTDLEVDYYGLTPGVVYYVSVDNLTGAGYRGTFKLCLSDVVDYNFYEGAIVLTDLNNWCSADAAYTTVNATADKNKGAAWDSGPNYNRWFKFTALTASVTIQLKTGAPEGNMQYPYLALWASNGTTGLASVNRAGQYNDLTINYGALVIGSEYYISVDNLVGTGYRGTFKLCINNVDPTAFYSRADGDWNTPSTWSNITYGGVASVATPGVGNVVYIRDNAINVTSAGQAAEINITTNAANTSLTIDNTTLTVNGRFIKTNAANNSNITTVQNDGVLSVANNLLVTRSGGNSNTQLNIPSGSVTVGQDMIWTSTSGTIANNTMTLSNSSSLAVGRDLTLSYSGGMKIGFAFNNNSTLSVGRDLTFTSTAATQTEAIFNNASAMSIKRNIVRGGTPFGILTFNNTSTLTFNGTANQQIIPASAGSGGDAITYNHVVFNNTSGFAIDYTMGGVVSIPGSITLTQGILRTTGASYLALLHGCISSLGSVSSYVDGPMTIDLASNTPSTTLTFPLGKSGSYRPAVLSVTHSDNASATYTAEHFSSSAGALGYTLPGTIERVSGVRYWVINRSAVANLTSATATLYYGIGTSDGVTDPANLRVVKTNGAGTVWFDAGGTGSAAGTGTITSAPFATFSVITLGNATGGSNPLPIQLKSFEAKPMANKVDIQWVTASELNNDYFTLERSSDGQEFAEVVRIPGKGTKQSESSYDYLDERPIVGKSYYRLKQTDFDKKSTYSKIVLVELEMGHNPVVAVYPNPATEESFTVQMDGFVPEETVQIKLSDSMGRTLFIDQTTVGTSELHEIRINKTGLAPGVYVLTVRQRSINLFSRVVIN
jgi:hypothetical protein